MSQPILTNLPGSKIKLEFVVTPEEAKPFLEEAVREMSTAKPLPGFRPGKATYEDVKRAHGEMHIWEAALERIVRTEYVRTVLAQSLDTVGSPEISLQQLTPGQDIKFTVIAPVAPHVLSMPDFAACKVQTKKTEVKDEQVESAIQEMRNMRRSEALVDRPATLEDLVMIDLEMKKDHVILEGGTGKDYRVYLSEKHYIPGFAKELEGMKAGDERTFTLTFPEEHYQKHLSGQKVDFTAKAKGVYELKRPELDDEFAKGVGLDSLEKLREKLKENISVEETRRAEESAEIEMLEKLVDASKFSDVPDFLVNEEVQRMIRELEHGVEEQGMKWQEYLSSIKKTVDELKLNFAVQAMHRIKTAVLIKAIAKEQNIEIKEEDVDKEIDRILLNIKPDDKESRERVSSAEYRDYVASQMRNRKALERMKDGCISSF